RDGVLCLVEDLCGHHHRLDEQCHEEEEGDELSGGEVTADADPYADQDHGGVADRCDDLGERGDRHGQALGTDLGGAGGQHRGVDAVGGALFDAVCTDDGG